MICEHTNDDGSSCPSLATIRLTICDKTDAVHYCDRHVGTLIGDIIRLDMEDDESEKGEHNAEI